MQMLIPWVHAYMLIQPNVNYMTPRSLAEFLKLLELGFDGKQKGID